jgi:spermidine synthase
MNNIILLIGVLGIFVMSEIMDKSKINGFGSVVYSKKGANPQTGNIKVVLEDSHWLKLMFDDSYQSLTYIDDSGKAVPSVVGLEYQKTMINEFIKLKNKKRVLFVGLGASTIPSYLAWKYPSLNIICLEIDSNVININKEILKIQNIVVYPETPKKGQFLVRHGNAVKLIKEYSNLDTIFIDAYDNEKIPTDILNLSFLNNCKKSLSTNGVIIANIFTRFLPEYLSLIEKINNNIKKIPVEKNTIVIS